VRRSLWVFQLAQQVQEGSPEGLLVTSLQPNRSDCGEFVGDSNLPQLGSRRAYYVTTVSSHWTASGAGRIKAIRCIFWRDVPRLALLMLVREISSPALGM